LGIDRFPRSVQHRHARTIHSKCFSHVPAGRCAEEIDVGEHRVDCHARLAQGDGLFTARGLGHDEARIPQARGNTVSHERLVLDEENDEAVRTVGRGYGHERSLLQVKPWSLAPQIVCLLGLQGALDFFRVQGA